MKKYFKFFIIIIVAILSLSLTSCTRVLYLGYLGGSAIKYTLEGKYYKPPVNDFKTLDELCRNFDDRADVCFKIAQTFQTMKNPKMYEYYELAIKKGYRTKLSPEELVKYYDDKYANIKEAELDCNFTTRYIFDCYYYNRYYCSNCLCKKEEPSISSYYAKYELLKAKYEEISDPSKYCNKNNPDKRNCYNSYSIKLQKDEYKRCERYLKKFGWF